MKIIKEAIFWLAALMYLLISIVNKFIVPNYLMKLNIIQNSLVPFTNNHAEPVLMIIADCIIWGSTYLLAKNKKKINEKENI